MPGTNATSRPRSRAAEPLTAARADRQRLYEAAVQNPDADLDFMSRVYTRLRGRPPRSIREDFCGSGLTSATWVRRSRENSAVGIDLDARTLEWGRRHHQSGLDHDQAARVRLVRRNVLRPGPDASDVDAVLAMNFSYWVFKTRDALRGYFEAVRASMRRDGVFFLDHYGGWESQRPQTDRKRCKGFTYLWEQRSFNPVTFDADCRIHFEFRDGTSIRDAFTYDWRLWQIPEIRELLSEAGFRRTSVYWEGDDDKGGGNGVFREVTRPEVCPVHIAYIVAAR